MYEAGQPHPPTPLFPDSPSKRGYEADMEIAKVIDTSLARVYRLLSIYLTVTVVGLIVMTVIALL